MSPIKLEEVIPFAKKELGDEVFFLVGGPDVMEPLVSFNTEKIPTYPEVSPPARFDLNGNLIPIGEGVEIRDDWLEAPCEKIWAFAPGRYAEILVLRPVE